MPLEVAALLHSTFRLQQGLSKNATRMNSCGSSRRGGPGFVAAARRRGGESWGALARPSCRSAAKEASDPDPSNGSEECTTLGLSETEKNHIPKLRLISDQARKGFCLHWVPSSLCAALIHEQHCFRSRQLLRLPHSAHSFLGCLVKAEACALVCFKMLCGELLLPQE